MTSFFTGEYSYSEQCVRDTNRPNRLGILSTRVSKFITILFYTDDTLYKITICRIRVWRDQDFEGDLQRTANECESPGTESYIRSVPMAILQPLFQYTIPSLTHSAKSNPAVVFQVHIHALPRQHFQSSSRHLCLSKCIAVESCKPILVLRLEIYSISYARLQTWNFDCPW